MRRTRMWLIIFILCLIALSFWSLYPSLRYWSMDYVTKKWLEKNEPEKLVNLEKRALKLGLDLRGGMHVVLQVDKTKLSDEEKKDAVERALEIIRNRVDQFGVAEPMIQKQGEDRIVVELPGLQDVERAQELIGRTAQLEFKLLPEPAVTTDLINQIDKVLAESTKTITGKEKGKEKKEKEVKDLFGKEKTDTTKKAVEDTAKKDIFAESTAAGEEEELPSDKPFSSLLEPTRSFSFYVLGNDRLKIERMLQNPEVQKIFPPDLEFAWGTKREAIRGEEFERFYILKRRVEFTGKYLTDAKPRYDEFHTPEVTFTLTKQGGRRFATLTGANIDKPLAITLDGRVESAPVIQSKIRDNGRITMGTGSTYEDASDLAIVLRAGALPAPVKMAENRVIGPSLGQDSINKGALAAVIGVLAVILLMGIYYKLSGVIADFALLFNIYFLLAAMAALNATLTMPGIAGIILTIGMSVDSNVLILERIREELRTGKTIRASIDAGYKRALLTIIDSHVTTLITAAVLFQFGTGPIKGFAVSLSLGVIISLFTALVITRIIYDLRKGYQTLSI
jgi:protein-export membrane protein SecD